MTESASPAAVLSRAALATMLGSCAFFAAMSTCVAAAHQRDPTLDVVLPSAVRAAVNLLVLLALQRFDLKKLRGDGRSALWLRGVMGAASLLLYFGALSRVGAGEAAFLNYTSAFWVASLAPLWLGERTSTAAWTAIAASIAGAALLGWPRQAGPFAGSDLAGRAAGLVSGFTAAVAYVSVRKASATNSPVVIVFYFTIVSTLVTGVAALALGTTLPSDPVAWAFLVAAGLFATAGQLWMTAAYAMGPAAPLSAATAATPLFTTLLAAIFLGKLPDALAGAGMLLLSVGGIALPLATSRRGLPPADPR